MPFPQSNGFPGSLVIFEHPAALYRYSPALEMHQIHDPRFDDFSTYLDLQTFITVFNETFEKALQSGMPVITIPYTPLMARVLHVCLHKYYSGLLDHWLCVSFFHDDKDTAKITLASGESPLDYKVEILKELLVFPFIKKIEIPYDFLLTYPSLYNLLETVI
jgi:hypothetical protein